MDDMIRNELMFFYRNYPLCKLEESNHKDWNISKSELLQNEKGFNDAMISNIRAKVFNSKVGSYWLLERYNGLTPTTTPAPNIFNKAVKEYPKLELEDLSQSGMQFDARVAFTLDKVNEGTCQQWTLPL